MEPGDARDLVLALRTIRLITVATEHEKSLSTLDHEFLSHC